MSSQDPYLEVRKILYLLIYKHVLVVKTPSIDKKTGLVNHTNKETRFHSHSTNKTIFVEKHTDHITLTSHYECSCCLFHTHDGENTFMWQKWLRKGTWTAEEDRKLIAYVTRYGSWNWRQLPKFAGLARCGKSCRLRWLNYLRLNIKRGNFTQQEAEIIVRMHKKLGNRYIYIITITIYINIHNQS